MWNFLWQKKQRKQEEREFRFTVIAPETRGQEETMALRENADDLGAAVALRQIIESSRPQKLRVISSQMTSRLSVNTHVSNVSADSEEYIRDPYAAADSVDDFVIADKAKGNEVEQPKIICGNILKDPVGTILHVTAAAALAAGPPGRQYITSGPPPPDQRGRAQITSQSQSSPTPLPPRRRTLTQRHRSVSSPAMVRDRHGVSPSSRSARSL
ncbi:hypothetical protein DHEL01_v203532 [Diaporthe helianthi]|uniref:Uncharacterized protein n=1 Tax=Diaporthe helianthi TaxID=158607 RepID=A0A2P5I6E8_DIAHE|nr:hypothetical protein DHEL01_v203532 [Diaporthe helianthi]